MNEIKIRHYEEDDDVDVKEIFALGISEQVPTSCLHVLKQPLTQMLLACVFCALLASSKSLLLPILAVTLILAAGRQRINYKFSRYIQFSLDNDLNHIRKTYIEQANSCFWVAECQGQVVGAAACASAERNEGCMELKRMLVKHSHRRQGIATMLCRTVSEFARENGFQAVVLYTSVVQTGAQRLYEKVGYKRIKEFFSPGLVTKVINFTLFEYRLDLQQPEN